MKLAQCSPLLCKLAHDKKILQHDASGASASLRISSMRDFTCVTPFPIRTSLPLLFHHVRPHGRPQTERRAKLAFVFGRVRDILSVIMDPSLHCLTPLFTFLSTLYSVGRREFPIHIRAFCLYNTKHLIARLRDSALRLPHESYHIHVRRLDQEV